MSMEELLKKPDAFNYGIIRPKKLINKKYNLFDDNRIFFVKNITNNKNILTEEIVDILIVINDDYCFELFSYYGKERLSELNFNAFNKANNKHLWFQFLKRKNISFEMMMDIYIKCPNIIIQDLILSSELWSSTPIETIIKYCNKTKNSFFLWKIAKRKDLIDNIHNYIELFDDKIFLNIAIHLIWNKKLL